MSFRTKAKETRSLTKPVVEFVAPTMRIRLVSASVSVSVLVNELGRE